MLVCHCNGISDRTIQRAVRKGASTLGEVRAACGAGGCCGSCAPTIRGLIRTESARQTSENENSVERPQTAAFA